MTQLGISRLAALTFQPHTLLMCLFLKICCDPLFQIILTQGFTLLRNALMVMMINFKGLESLAEADPKNVKIERFIAVKYPIL